MKKTYYLASIDVKGIDEGKIYYEGEDKKIILNSGEKVSALPYTRKHILRPIPHYEGSLKEEWSPKKTEIRVQVSDGMGVEEHVVKIIEFHKYRESLICLVKIPGAEGNVQLDIPHLHVA